MTDLHQTYQTALENAGVPENLAEECATILTRDDPSQPNLGRSEDDQATINESMQYVILAH